MKPASAGLISLLASGQFLMADLFTFTLSDASVVRYTSADIPIKVDVNTWNPAVIKRSNIKLACGIQVDDLTINFYPDTETLGNLPALQAMNVGVLDGARVTLERAFMSTWGDTSLGTLVLFTGRVADLEVNREGATITVKTDLEILDVQLPRNLFLPSCVWTLFDSGCALNKASFAVSDTVRTPAATRTYFRSHLTAYPAGYFALGTIEFTTGALVGIKRTVKAFDDSDTSFPGQGFIIQVSFPYPSIPQVGDAFTVYPGCDKRSSTCVTKFNNNMNFRGYPDVPVPETGI